MVRVAKKRGIVKFCQKAFLTSVLLLLLCGYQPVSVEKKSLADAEDLTVPCTISSESSKSGSSINDLISTHRLCSAVGRVRRESRLSEEGNECSYLSPLNNQLSSKLDKLDLITSNKQNRATVIAQNISKPNTSTPSNSFSNPPVPPLSCPSFGTERSNTHSFCSEISSIGEVFQEAEDEAVPEGYIPAVPHPNPHSNQLEPDQLLQMEEEIQKLNSRNNRLYRMISIFDIDDVNISTVSRVEVKVETVEQFALDLADDIDELLMTYGSQLDDRTQNTWKATMNKILADSKAYSTRMFGKVDSIRGNAGPGAQGTSMIDNSSFMSEKLKLLKKQNEILEAEKLNRLNQSTSEANAKHTAAVAKAKNKTDAIEADVKALEEKLSKVELGKWKDEPDLVIARGMRELKTWDAEMSKIVATFRDLNDIMAENSLNLSESGVTASDILVKRVKDKVKATSEEIKQQDESRELYTLDESKSDLVTLPTFEGRMDEDYDRWKELVEKAFVSNRVTKSDKLEKLRKVLKGDALKLVPSSTVTTIDEAFEALKKAYGDPWRLMKYRKDAIVKLGELPRSNKTNSKSIVQWYIEMEAIVKSVIELGKKSTDLDREAFSKTSFDNIIRPFPPNLQDKLLKCTSEGSSKMEEMLVKIKEFRVSAQNRQSVNESASSNPDVRKTSFGPAFQKLVAFKPPRRYEECRICQVLESKGDTLNLYDGHVNSYPTGCPRYASMTNDERLPVAKQARFCLWCHDPDYLFKPNDHAHKKSCPIVKKKSHYSCKDSNCNMHMWVCNQHKSKNEEAMKKFKTQVERNHGWNLGMPVVFPKVRNVGANGASLNVRKSSSSKRKSCKESDKQDKQVDKKPKIADKGPEVYEQQLPPPQHGKILSSDQAEKKLRRKLKANGIDCEVRSIPKGSPTFIIGMTKGKTRGLLTLYDTGCGTVLFRSGVPNYELGPSTLKQPGPFYVNGVGNTTVVVENEYQCTVELNDGSRQVLEGWTVPQITATLPMISMTLAEQDIKSSDPENKALQELKCQPVVGGDCDILFGMQYKNVFPKEVHQLDNGLTIYRLQTVSHDAKFNCSIGGPHESFAFLASHYGGMATVFMNLCQQLQNYKDFGPPKLSRSIMTVEELRFSKHYNDWEMKNICMNSTEDYSTVEAISAPIEKVTIEEIHDEEDSNEDGVLSNLCYYCSEVIYDEEVPSNKCLHLGLDKSKEKFEESQTEGLNVEYRCPKCRSCSSCRRSFETEKVSAREEAEDLLIYDSVNIDWENQRIMCRIPLRGPEEQFLADSNREIAVRILNQQCQKYHKDDDTRNLIVKSFDKLISRGHMVRFDELPDEVKKIIESKKVNYWIPWRVVFKESISTPCRMVFDGSQNTKVRPDGTAGRNLNDMTVKGKVTSLNLVRMLLCFTVGLYAAQGDLSQFYASMKLTNEQWNLQRCLFKNNMDPSAEELEYIITTLIWGIKCVSGQSECAILKIAEAIKEKNPQLSFLLIYCRFVDDLGPSTDSESKLRELVHDADDLFSKVGLSCKGWSFSGQSPPPEVTEDGETVGIGGMRWHTKLDLLEVLLPPLHFSKRSRGRLEVGTNVFDGKFTEDMDKFVPKELTRRQILGKISSIFDPLGKLTPITVGLKLDFRRVIKATLGWDEPISDNLRSKWVSNFLRMEKLKGLKFSRPRMPINAASSKMHLLIAVDAADEVIDVGAWVRFRLKQGGFSCQHLISRALLAGDESIPKKELNALMMGSNLGWIIRLALEGWIESYLLGGDSIISLFWVSSEKKRLSLFHRNRCIQIRRGTDMDSIFHIVTECNPADLPTRPELVKDEDVGPNSKWEVGLPWMRGEVEDAVSKGILKPISDLRMSKEEEESYNEGFVYEKMPEILTPGHVVMQASTRIENVKNRAEFSNYLISPTKFKFEKTVRVLAIVWKFLKSFKCRAHKFKKDEKIENQEVRFKMLTIVDGTQANLSFGCKSPGRFFKGKFHVRISDDDISRSLHYFFKKGSEEVQKFYKSEYLKKICFLHDGLLLCKSRILDTQRFRVAGGLENSNILKPDQFGLVSVSPVLDRYSPLSYSIADYIHRIVSRHSGYETCLRNSLQFCYIIQGLSLFREMNEDCVKCIKMRGKYFDVKEGPVADEQLTVAPPMWVAMTDIFGPLKIYPPGRSRETRGKKPEDYKCWVMVFLCPTTKLINLQLIEGHTADAITEGVSRLGCEVGIPSYVVVDQDSSILKVLNEAEINMKDLELILFKEKGIKYRTCPVSGHNMSGGVERVIRTVQECLEKMDISSYRFHATGLITILKLIENDYNNCPLGYRYGRDADNSPLLKLVFPNMLRIGRLNARALDGPLKLPGSPGEMMDKVHKCYEVFYKVWNDCVVPKLMRMHKWFDDKYQPKIGDLVYFQKSDSDKSSKWLLGKIVRVSKSKDDVVRRCDVQYSNENEDGTRTTDRAARSLIRLFNIDDTSWRQEMDAVDAMVKVFQNEDKVWDTSISMMRSRQYAVGGFPLPRRHKGVQNCDKSKNAKAATFVRPKCKKCCCKAHCSITEHRRKTKEEKDMNTMFPQLSMAKYLFPALIDECLSYDVVQDASDVLEDEAEDVPVNFVDENAVSGRTEVNRCDDSEGQKVMGDEFTAMLCSVNANFSEGGGGDVLNSFLFA